MQVAGQRTRRFGKPVWLQDAVGGGFSSYLAARNSVSIGCDVMYPKNAATPPEVDLGQMLLIADGTIQTAGASVRVKIGTGAWGAGAGSASCDATSGIWTYAPTQAETNADYFIVGLYKSSCTALSKTVITSASATAGYAGVDWSKVTAPTTTLNLSGTTVKTATDVETDTADIQSRLPAALVSGRIDASTGAMAANVVTAAAIADGAIDAATFAADVDAEILSYIVDDATRIDASSLNTASATSIPAILADTGTDGVVVAAGSKTGYSLTATTGLGNQTADITGTITTVTNLTNAPTSGDLTATMKASVNAEVLDVLNVDTFAELSAPPAATSSLRAKLTWLFMWARNKATSTSSQRKLYADDGTTVVSTEALSDDSTTYTKGEAS